MNARHRGARSVEEYVLYSLEQLGFGALSPQCDETDRTRIARVASEHGDRFEVIAENTDRFIVTLPGSMRDERAAVGDFVEIDETRERIARILPRRSALVRQAAGGKTKRQIIATNVDIVFVVTSMNAEFNESRLERYIAAVWESGATPVVLLNKADLAGDRGHFVSRTYAAAPGVDVVSMTAVTEDVAALLETHLGTGRTFVFVGSSGVGKSTIVNALVGHEVQDTGAIRDDDDEGRHTTTRRDLIVLEDRGVLIDTPGMRELQLWDAQAGIAAAFEDIEALGAMCRFRDCAHQSEPGCAIAEAIDAGTLEVRRLANYQKLQREAAYHDRKRNRAAERQFGRDWAKKIRETNADSW